MGILDKQRARKEEKIKKQEELKKSMKGIAEKSKISIRNIRREGKDELKKLLDKIRNTKQTFIFAYRGKPSDKRIKQFFHDYGIEYAHITSSAHVSLKELKCHDEWASFTEGAPKSLKQINNKYTFTQNEYEV